VNFYGALSFVQIPQSSFQYLSNTIHLGIVVDLHAIIEWSRGTKQKKTMEVK